MSPGSRAVEAACILPASSAGFKDFGRRDGLGLDAGPGLVGLELLLVLFEGLAVLVGDPLEVLVAVPERPRPAG